MRRASCLASVVRTLLVGTVIGGVLPPGFEAQTPPAELPRLEIPRRNVIHHRAKAPGHDHEGQRVCNAETPPEKCDDGEREQDTAQQHGRKVDGHPAIRLV